MRITREKHLSYITRLMPFLILAYIGQSYLYLKFAPRHLAVDVSLFVGVGIVLIALAFTLYDHFHKVTLHHNHLAISIEVLNYQEEILYGHIQSIEVEVSKHAYYNVTLNLRDGRSVKMYYLDDVQDLKHLVKCA